MYEVIETKIGTPTMRISMEDKSIYLHSRYNPIKEAINIAEENYGSEIKNYVIFGLGFGYHVLELIKMASNSNFYIIETNEDIYKLACKNVDLSNMTSNSKVKLYVTEDISKIKNILKNLIELEHTKIVIHTPSLNVMSEKLIDIKYLLEELKMLKNSAKDYSSIMEENFSFNIRKYDENVDILFNKFQYIPLYIVSAGPSLDKNIKELSNIKNKGIILSVGRAVRSLIKVGIEPDIIVITDPSDHLYDMQLKDIDIKVPIIVLSTCDKDVMLNYKGYKLIALQNDYDLAEKYAARYNRQLVNTGGSVATTALDIAIKMGCNPIIFVGQDLAFTNDKTHSEDTYSRNIKQFNNFRKVKDICGVEINTSKNLYIYLRWIQNRIAEEKDITFIDATEGGAKIEGAKIYSLKKSIERYSYKDISKNLDLLKELSI